mmetsp:Transcript_1991/g.4613  ORF Transcript_1991/g.4613 Transcript_1991/m.4613 type:complete len:296 (+) Transcript_1991:120-1007(+)
MLSPVEIIGALCSSTSFLIRCDAGADACSCDILDRDAPSALLDLVLVLGYNLAAHLQCMWDVHAFRSDPCDRRFYDDILAHDVVLRMLLRKHYPRVVEEGADRKALVLKDVLDRLHRAVLDVHRTRGGARQTTRPCGRHVVCLCVEPSPFANKLRLRLLEDVVQHRREFPVLLVPTSQSRSLLFLFGFLLLFAFVRVCGSFAQQLLVDPVIGPDVLWYSFALRCTGSRSSCLKLKTSIFCCVSLLLVELCRCMQERLRCRPHQQQVMSIHFHLVPRCCGGSMSAVGAFLTGGGRG